MATIKGLKTARGTCMHLHSQYFVGAVHTCVTSTVSLENFYNCLMVATCNLCIVG